MLTLRTALLPCLALVLSAPSFAQGSDLGTTPQPISGSGAFPFDNTAAATDGVPDTLCGTGTLGNITKDVWFAWTASATGSVNLSTCGQTTIDSKVAVYDGVWTGPILACNDDACASLQTSLDFSAVNGNVYVIRVGNYPSGAQTPGTGTFTLTPAVPPTVIDTQVNPNNGRTYHLLSPSPWLEAETVAVALGGHLATVDDAIENEWIRSTWQNFPAAPRHLWIGLNDIAVEGTYEWIDGTPVSYLTWNAGEPNNGAGGEDYTCMVKDSLTGAWNDLQLPAAPPGYWSGVYGVVEISGTPSTSFCSGDAVGTACLGCGNNGGVGRGCGNSSFANGAALTTNGTASVTADTLVLTGSDLTGPGLFFQANGLISAITFGDGMLCAGIGIIRMGVVFPTAGTASYPGGLTPAPISVAGGPISANDTKHYQVWYRDAVPFCTSATYNLTQGVSLVWTP
jgi:hypothetical protein